MKFLKLTPYNDDPDYKLSDAYKQALDFVFTKNDLRNIAISGAYGAGKTTVFEYYMRNYKQREKILRISLAHFSKNNNEDSSNCDSLKSNPEKILEAKIINQLIHQISPNNIKKTSFIAHITTNQEVEIQSALAITLLLTGGGFLLFSNNLKTVLNEISFEPLKTILNFLVSANSLITIGIALTLLFSIMLTRVVLSFTQRFRGNNILSKLSIKNITLDLHENETESYFDKYLSEIRYLFENSGANIVAIDDIDRYCCESIFEKIRELNTIVNYDREIPIKFFYIIKDDLFESKDRTKFFDFIIPIIPVVDASNSYSILWSQLMKESSLDFNKRFLRGLSFFIDDMRITKNIINEFNVYYSNLAMQHLDPNKLLAFITYKNLFPKDFNSFQLGTGYLFELSNSRKHFIDLLVAEKETAIKNIEIKIEMAENENLLSQQELAVIYGKPIRGLDKVNNKRADSFVTNSALYNELLSTTVPISVYTQSSGSETIQPELYINEMQKVPDYQKRKEILDVKLQRGISKLQEQKQKLQSDIQSIKESHSFSKIINESNFQEFLDYPQKINREPEIAFQEIRNDPHFKIIRFLIQNKMLDGYYQDYLTYFYSNEIQIEDQRFIRSVFDTIPLPVDHQLTNPKSVLEILEYVSEGNPAYMNYSLFQYVFDHKIQKEAARFIKLVRSCENKILVSRYLQNGAEPRFLLSNLNSYWDTFFSDAYADEKWTEKDRNQFLLLELSYEDPEKIKELNVLNDFCSAINQNQNLFSYALNNAVNRIINNLIVIGAKLQDVRVLKFPATINFGIDGFLDKIFKNNLYKMSVTNCRFWLEKYFGYEINNKYERFLSNVLIKSNEPLYSYVISHLDELINDLVAISPNEFFDDNENTIFLILSTDSCSFDTKTKYIEKLLHPVENLFDLDDIEITKLLLEKDKIEFSLNNLLQVFSAYEYTLSEELISFLLKHQSNTIVGKSINSDQFSNETVHQFFDSILAEKSLGKEITITLLSFIGTKISNQIEIIDIDKEEAIIISHSLVMNENNLGFVRKNYPDLKLIFQKSNLQEFKDLLRLGINTNSQEIVNLLESDLNGIEQRSLLRSVTIRIPYKTSYRFSSVKKYIITSLLNPEDLQLVVNDPETNSQELKRPVLEAIYTNIDYVIQNTIQIPYYLLIEIINEKKITRDNMIELFINSIKNYSPENIKSIILSLDLMPFNLIYEGKHPKPENTQINIRIIFGLLDKGIVSQGKDNQLYLLKGNNSK